MRVVQQKPAKHASHEYCVMQSHDSIRIWHQLKCIMGISVTVQESDVWHSKKHGLSHSTPCQAKSEYCDSVLGRGEFSTSQDSMTDARHVQQCLCVKNNSERLFQTVSPRLTTNS
jgi:hypothetical protein